MDITRLADNSYKIKGKKGSVVVNVGMSVLITGTINKNAFEITKPGEYEVEGISVFAYASNESLVSLVTVEDVKVLTIEQKISDSLIEEMDTVDVVILGTDKISSKELIELVGKIEPSSIVPSGEMVETFAKDFEHGSRESDKLALSKATMSADTTEVVVLT